MEDETKKKGRPCPACRQNLVLQYKKDQPHIRQDPVSGRFRVPMRCTRCGINLEVSLDPKEMLEPNEDEE